MSSLYVCLSTVLLWVSGSGYEYNLNGWTMHGPDEVIAEEGQSAVLPCRFTAPFPGRTVSGSVIWFKKDSLSRHVPFNCIYYGPGHSRSKLCENVIQKDGGNRYRFVGNLSDNDASIMMEGLNQMDSGYYKCHVELNIGKFESLELTSLGVRAAGGNVPVVSGTEGGSVTLPCMFTPPSGITLQLSVTWMRKEPYQHKVTFRVQSNGSWTTVNGGNRYELVGNPMKGNASTRINQLSVKNSSTYLCLVEHKGWNKNKPNEYLVQNETRLQVFQTAGGNVPVVSGTEGGSVTLPCMFTPPSGITLQLSVTWMRKEPYQHKVTFRAQSNGSWTTVNGGNRYELVGDPMKGNASTRINQLSVKNSSTYLCLVEHKGWNKNKPNDYLVQNETRLQVFQTAGGNVPVVSGTEGGSVTLPCMFTWPRGIITRLSVTWMRKEPYQHKVTFRAQSNGSWTRVNGGNRYELVGNPMKGNASTRINELSVKNSSTYLCLVEHKGWNKNKPNDYLVQNETRLQVFQRKPSSLIAIICLPVILLLILLLILFIIVRNKGGCSWLMRSLRGTIRNDLGSSNTAVTDQDHQLSIPARHDSCTYADIMIDSSRKDQPDFCTYANLVIDNNRKVQGGKGLTVAASEENVTYAAVVTTH
ncbi:polymeric immunoglobulin receptor-like isoform X2 [Heptranchias perlo]|uniref:polymeric immunoglobulin receptor-like isoform X2 n=1 Tax=Heptranchias perlo TaxID=212740 RepID=UPI0035596861